MLEIWVRSFITLWVILHVWNKCFIIAKQINKTQKNNTTPHTKTAVLCDPSVLGGDSGLGGQAKIFWWLLTGDSSLSPLLEPMANLRRQGSHPRTQSHDDRARSKELERHRWLRQTQCQVPSDAQLLGFTFCQRRQCSYMWQWEQSFPEKAENSSSNKLAGVSENHSFSRTRSRASV